MDAEALILRPPVAKTQASCVFLVSVPDHKSRPSPDTEDDEGVAKCNYHVTTYSPREGK